MKIISGEYKGRILKGFDIKGTRPTMDRVKESLFAMVQDYIKDAVVLDLYSGTGNLGIEAISNGAKKAYLVDNNVIAINTINENIKNLKVRDTYVIKGNAQSILNDLLIKGIIFDIVFLDPPYHTNELEKTLSFLNDNPSMLSDNGVIVCETEIDIDYSKYDKFYIYKNRAYGSKKIFILKKYK